MNNVEFNNSELFFRIKEKYKTLSNFAEVLDVSLTTLSLKINNRSGMSREEILKWAELLDIPRKKIGEIFFTKGKG